MRKARQKAVMAVVLSSLICTVMPAMADPSETELPPVEVSANQEVAAKEPLGSNQLGSNLLVIPESSKLSTVTFTHQDIENMHPQDITQIINSIPGLEGMTWGGKNYYRVSDRGGDMVGFILDGVYLPETQVSRIITAIPVDIIDSITFVRDSSILTLGPVATIANNFGQSGDSNQGYIIIKTIQPTEKTAKVRASYGTYNTQNDSLVDGDKFNGTGYYSLGYDRSESNGRPGWHDAYNYDTYFGSFGDKGKDWSYDTSVFVNDGWRDFENIAGVTLNTSKWDPLDTTIVSVEGEKKWNGHSSTDVSFGYSSVLGTNWATLTSNAKVVDNWNEDEYWRELNLMQTLNYGRDTIKFGTQDIWWNSPTGVQGTLVTSTGQPLPYPREEDLFGYYVYGERKVDDKLTLDSAFRIDRKDIIEGLGKYFFMSGVNNQPLPAGFTSWSQFDQAYGPVWEGDSTSYTLGADYKMNQVYDLTTRIGYTDQGTSKCDLDSNGNEMPDEIRYKLETGIGAKYSKAFNTSVTGYYYDIKNARVENGVLGYDADDDPVYTYTAADLDRYGGEASVYGNITKQLSYKGGYAYFNSTNALDSANFPHNKASMSLNYHNNDISANLMLMYFSSYAVATSNPSLAGTLSTSMGITGGFTTVDANISKDINANTKVTIFGHNITNKLYLIGGGNYDPGATYGIELSKKF